MVIPKRFLCVIVLTSLFGARVYGCQEVPSASECVRLAQHGKYWDLKHLLDRWQVPIDIRGDEGGTALHWACRNRHSAIVHLLVNKGAQLDARCRRGATPLHWAAYAGHDEIVQFLFEAGWYLVPSLVFARDNFRLTPLHWVADSGNRRSLQLLLDYGADMYAEDSQALTPFITALNVGHIVMLKEFIRRGFKNHRNSRGRTPLNEVLAKGFGSIARFWIVRGVDVTVKDWLHRNVLHQAAYCGCADLVVFLVQTTTLDVDAQSKLGTPLHLAIAKGRINVVKALVQHGACVDIGDLMGKTALHIIIQKCSVDPLRYRKRSRQILHWMLDFGVNIDPKAKRMLIQYGEARYFTGHRYQEIKCEMVRMYVSWLDALGEKYQTTLPADICNLIALFMVTASQEE